MMTKQKYLNCEENLHSKIVPLQAKKTAEIKLELWKRQPFSNAGAGGK